MTEHGELGSVLDVAQTCIECGTERHRLLDPATGVRLGAYYRYPEGYLRKGQGRATVEELGRLRLTGLESVVGRRRIQRMRYKVYGGGK